MADKLRITNESLSKDIESFRANVNNISAAFKSMNDEVSQLHAMWAGDAHEAFRAQFDSDMQMAFDIVNEMQKFAAKLDGANDEYRKCSQRVDTYIDSIKL